MVATPIYSKRQIEKFPSPEQIGEHRAKKVKTAKEVGGFWPGRMGDGGRQAEATASVSDRLESIRARATVKWSGSRRPRVSSGVWKMRSVFSAAFPAPLIIDNLRAAVTRADWYDPELNAKVASAQLAPLADRRPKPVLSPNPA